MRSAVRMRWSKAVASGPAVLASAVSSAGGDTSGNYNQAQQFTPAATITVSKIKVRITTAAHSRSGLDVSLGTTFSNQSLAKVSGVDSSVQDASGYTTVTLAAPVTLTGGTAYWLEINDPNFATLYFFSGTSMTSTGLTLGTFFFNGSNTFAGHWLDFILLG